MSILGMIGGGMAGAIMQDWNQTNQLDQQRKLMGMQIKGAKEMADYNQIKNMEMWKNTNYKPQMEEIAKAGLNPALLYGMKGGGGTTVGTGGGGMPSVATAEGPSAANKNIMDMALMVSNKKLLDAQTKKTEAEAANVTTNTTKTAGVDTDKTKAEIDNLLQGYDNLRQTHTLGNLEITMRNILNYEQQAGQESRLQQIETNAKKGLEELRILQNESKMSDELYNQKITKFKTEVIGAAIHNALAAAGVQKTYSDIAANKQQIQNWYESNMREWDKMGFEERKVKVQELLKDFHTDENRDITDKVLKAISVLK